MTNGNSRHLNITAISIPVARTALITHRSKNATYIPSTLTKALQWDERTPVEPSAISIDGKKAILVQETNSGEVLYKSRNGWYILLFDKYISKELGFDPSPDGGKWLDKSVSLEHSLYGRSLVMRIVRRQS